MQNVHADSYQSISDRFASSEISDEERKRLERIEALEREITPIVNEAYQTTERYGYHRRVEQPDIDTYNSALSKIKELVALRSVEEYGYRYTYEKERELISYAISIMLIELGENPYEDAAKKRSSLDFIINDLTSAAIGNMISEVLKATQVKRTTKESSETYKLQEALRQDASDIGDKLTQIDSACTNLTSGDQITTVSGASGHYALVANEHFIGDLNSKYGNTRTTILASNAQSVKEYCSEFDARMQRCSTATVSFPGGDMLATTLLGSEGSGEGTSETYVSGQIEAANAYINRVVPPRLIPGPLPMKCDTQQCKAYDELRAQAIARALAARNSLATLAGRRTSVVDMPASDGVATLEKGLASSPEN